MEKLLSHQEEFDAIYGGPGKADSRALAIFYEAACKVMAGEDLILPEKNSNSRRPVIMDERDAEGYLIYDCQMPHSVDAPKDGFFKVNPNMVEFEYKGYRFSYDKTLK